MPSTITSEEYYQAAFLLGPWLVGSFVEVLLQGVIFCQFSHYLSWYRDDKLLLKGAVYTLILLTTLKSIHALALIWIQFIEYFTDLQGAILLNYVTWWQSGNPLMVAFIGLYVQIYFLWRLWAIAKNIIVVVPIAIIFAFAFTSICVATYYITLADGPKIGMWFAAHLSSVFAGDLILTLTTAFFLLRSKRNVLPQTIGLIDSLIRLTFQTAAPAAVCAMLNLVFSQVYQGEDKLISTAFNLIMPKLYAISMMWTLNARRNIRAMHSSRSEGQSVGSNEMDRTRRTMPRFTDRTDLELGSIGGIQVRTQKETVRHIDFDDQSDTPPKKLDRSLSDSSQIRGEEIAYTRKDAF